MLLRSAGAAATEVWLSGLDPIMQADQGQETKSDYMQMFQPNAPWGRAAGNVRIFKLYGQFIDRGTDSDLAQTFLDLRRRHIALALEIGVVPPHDQCGSHLEGFIDPSLLEKVLGRISRLGGDLRYLAMDEPLTSADVCHTDITALAKAVAGSVGMIRRYFPDVQIGDIEGVGRTAPTNWVDRNTRWIKAYQEAAGRPLAFFHLDVFWPGPWRQSVAGFPPVLHAAGIKFGIIYDGDPDDQTGVAWTRHAEQRFVAVEADSTLVPDQAILQSWMLQPDHMLPETETGTMTWLVNRYIAAQTKLVFQQAGARLQGVLNDTAGQPLANAAVALSAEVAGEPDAPVAHTRSGHVPPRAVAAIFALRINSECNCSSSADITIGPIQYHDDRSGHTEQQAFRPPPATGGALALARFQVSAGQSISQNTQRFAVTADDPFTIQVPMHGDVASAGSGFMALIFFDAKGKEMERLKFPFEPAEVPVGTLTTDPQGRFSLLPNPNTLRTSVGFRAEFLGDAQHRISSMNLR